MQVFHTRTRTDRDVELGPSLVELDVASPVGRLFAGDPNLNRVELRRHVPYPTGGDYEVEVNVYELAARSAKELVELDYIEEL